MRSGFVGLFGDRSYEEFATILYAANAAFGKAGPSGWTQLKMSDIGIKQNGDTYTSPNNRGKAIVLQQDDQLIVAFRGTDKFNDIEDYYDISAVKSYARQFDKLLDALKVYQNSNGLETTFTGISLGGAVTNIIADKSDNQWGDAFKNSTYLGIASPYLSNNTHRDLTNFGIQNDLVYGVVPNSWNPRSKSMAAENVYIYENGRRFVDNLDDQLSPHHVGGLNSAIKSLDGLITMTGARLVDELKQDSYVIFDRTKEVLKASELDHPDFHVLTIIGESRDDRINGADKGNRGGNEERVFGRGGNDVISTRQGRDELHGGSGDDVLNGGNGADWMYGDAGDDRLILADHRDLAEGGDGSDRFVIQTIGKGGAQPAQVMLPDFKPGEDKIDFRDFDGNNMKKGVQSLKVVEYVQYTDGQSELERGFVNNLKPGGITIYEDQFDNTWLIINRDDDRNREFVIQFDGALGDFSASLLL